MSSSISVPFPRQDIPLKDKNEAWLKSHLDYAEGVLRNYGRNRDRMNRLYESYNGIKTPGSLAWLERNYGKQNKSKYVAYRLGRTKMSLLHGEFLKRPLAATVTTINSDAMSEKMRQMDFMIGAMLAKKEIADLKNVGVDIMQGAPVPEDENDPVWKKMSPKDKQEDIMQIILDNQVKDLGLKKKLADSFLDLLITSMCYFKIEIDEQGDIKAYRIDPRDAIFEQIQGDDYIEKSPVKGCRQVLPVHEILLRYNLNKTQRDMLNAARLNPDLYIGSDGIGRGYMKLNNGELLCDVIHIEWDSVEPEYYKKAPKTPQQKMLDPSDEPLEFEMDTEYYEGNPELHEKNIKAGKYTVETRYKTVKYEATRIGGCIDVNMRKKYFQTRKVDDPSKVLDSTYHGYIHSPVDGVVVSMQQVIENFDNLYDVVMYQINKQVARAKGVALFYDRAGMPEGKTMKEVMYQVFNDGYIDWNSAASGNYSQKNLDMTNAIRQVDLGLSNTFEYLVSMKNNIVNDLNQITGINENREGQIAASSTATNANSAIQASRTITEPLFAGMEGLVKKVMQSVVDTSSISWAFYKVEKGEQILGTEKHRYLQVTSELGYRDYGVHIEDGGKYAEMRQIMKEAMMVSLNAKELRPIDFYKVSMAETMAEAEATLITSWEKVQEGIRMSNEQNNKIQAQMEEMRLRQQVELSREDRDDRQGSELEKIDRKAHADIMVNREKAKDKMMENQQNAENDIILGG